MPLVIYGLEACKRIHIHVCIKVISNNQAHTWFKMMCKAIQVITNPIVNQLTEKKPYEICSLINYLEYYWFLCSNFL